ncbi:hypothetical protein ATANTOWER_004815 [Ataeniobius toweri]|uniref:Uncharacterized protein n=1 Tax=Ataeniobius toweri TaxID=208326 RepID=A0ABU7AED6_9TELE|nr:hypothetical protein [Ataeniobius toweri]
MRIWKYRNGFRLDMLGALVVIKNGMVQPYRPFQVRVHNQPIRFNEVILVEPVTDASMNLATVVLQAQKQQEFPEDSGCMPCNKAQRQNKETSGREPECGESETLLV